MGPTDIIATLVYVAPGFLAVELRYFLVPARRGSDFELLGWSILFSVIGYGAACGIAVAVCGNVWRSFAGIHHGEFIASQWLFALAAGIFVASLSSYEGMTRLLRKVGIEYSQFPSVWNEIWQRPEGAPWVKVRMTDGSVCCGAVALYTRDPQEAERELFLYPIFRLDENEEPAEKIQNVGLFVRSASIVSVEVLDWPPG